MNTRESQNLLEDKYSVQNIWKEAPTARGDRKAPGWQIRGPRTYPSGTP